MHPHRISVDSGRIACGAPRACLTKAEKVFEGVLHKQPCHNAHGRGQAGSTHSLPLERALINARGHHKGRDAGKAGSLARYDDLDAVQLHWLIAHL